MKNKVEKSALAFAALKSGQQIAHDLEGVILNNTVPDVLVFGAEQICRIGAAGAAAYTIDEAVSYLEELSLPKSIRGILPLTAATIGAATAINYFGNYFNIEQGLGILETTKQLLNHYQENLAKIITFNTDLSAGYLTGSLLTIKSGLRLIKNIGKTIAQKAEKRRMQRKYQEEQGIEQKDSNQRPEGL